MNSPYCVLVVDDEPSIGKLLLKELTTPARTVHVAGSAREARELLAKNEYEVAILDLRLPDANGLDLMVELRQRQEDLETILVTGHGAIDTAVEAMKLGAFDYVTKPFNLTELELLIERAYQRTFLRRENRRLRHFQGQTPPVKLIGNSPAMRQVRYLIEKVAPTEVPVLITGESGAGKEVAAHLIQSLSGRADKPFFIKNCATLQKELARSELPIEVQAALLRVLENKTYRRVGEKEERRVDIRLLFATNRELVREVAEGRFHEALFHRINVFNIEMPSLRERREDIPLLVEFFLSRLTAGQAPFRISDRAMKCLTAYDWPGNVRELRNVMERSIILSENNLITEHALPREFLEPARAEEEILTLEAKEKEHIAKVLNFYDNNRSLAAEALGICRKTLYRKIRQYGLF